MNYRRIIALIVTILICGLIIYFYGTVANPQYDPKIAALGENPYLSGEMKDWYNKVTQPTMNTPFFWGGILIAPGLFFTLSRILKDEHIQINKEQRVPFELLNWAYAIVFTIFLVWNAADIIAFDYNPRYDSAYHSETKEVLRSVSSTDLKKISPEAYNAAWGGSDTKYVANGFFWISLLVAPFLLFGIRQWMYWAVKKDET